MIPPTDTALLRHLPDTHRALTAAEQHAARHLRQANRARLAGALAQLRALVRKAKGTAQTAASLHLAR